MTYDDTLVLLTDDELDRMKSRSWYRAARLWSEARGPGSNVVRNMIADEAFSEDMFCNTLIREISRRAQARREAQEVPT